MGREKENLDEIFVFFKTGMGSGEIVKVDLNKPMEARSNSSNSSMDSTKITAIFCLSGDGIRRRTSSS